MNFFEEIHYWKNKIYVDELCELRGLEIGEGKTFVDDFFCWISSDN